MPMFTLASAILVLSSHAQDIETPPWDGPVGAYSNPRMIWASSGKLPRHDFYSDQYSHMVGYPRAFVRCRMKPAAGKWKSLAVVWYVGKKSDSGVPNPFRSDEVSGMRVRCSLELANGTLTPKTFGSPNTGGRVVPFTFMGDREVNVKQGEIVISDFVHASSLGLTSFEFGTRERYPWIRAAIEKLNPELPLQCGDQKLSISYYRNDRVALGSWDSLVNLVNAPGTGSRIAGTEPAYLPMPMPLGFIGIPESGQKAVVVFGTSQEEGEGDLPDYVDYPGAPGQADGPPDAGYSVSTGWPNRWAEDSAVGIPLLNCAKGGSALRNTFGTTATQLQQRSSTAESRYTWTKLARFFDVMVLSHTVNDATLIGEDSQYNVTRYSANLNWAITACRQANPALTIWGVRSGWSVGDLSTNAGQNQRDTDLPTLWNVVSTNTNVSRVLDFTGSSGLGSVAGKPWAWPVLASPFSAQITAATNDTLTLNTSAMRNNQWVNSYIRLQGVVRRVIWNTRNELIFDPPVSSTSGLVGTTASLIGNTSHDGLHANGFGARKLADVARTQLASQLTYIPRTDQ